MSKQHIFVSSWDAVKKGPSAVGGNLVVHHVCLCPGQGRGGMRWECVRLPSSQRAESAQGSQAPSASSRMDLPCVLVCLLLSGMWCPGVSYEEERFVLAQFFLQMQGLLPTSDCLPPSRVPGQHIQRGTCVPCMCHLGVLSQPRGGLTPNQIPCSKRNSWLKLLPLLPLAVVDIQHAFLLGRDQIQTTVPPRKPACRRTASTRHCSRHCQADGKTLLGRNALEKAVF